ncbi:thiamine-binding protein [Planococcus salinus]|uniref:Thiamine-binding protein n=1 Tax=Planococcus salinus TaxID=1848460 RepID=A0A3M8PC03_9BACL|nr:thiamine-binding protein [Planococcus salinus]RNF41245.1 thiamine-binding protein [Planococcus salinus]
MGNALLSIQIIPKTKDGEDVIPYVDQAIAIIEQSGVKYQVHALETTMEGDLTELFAIVEKMNKAMIDRGSRNVISQIKVLYQPAGASMDALTEKYRS